MCTILFSWKNTPGYQLILLANRDEFYERPTSTAHWWDDHSNLLGGRDLKAGGTWMAINKEGRFAAVTNYRKFPLEGPFHTSRGELVTNFLTSGIQPEKYFEELDRNRQSYDGYNLIFGDRNRLFYHSNRGPGKALTPDNYGLSNHLLDTPWPKVKKGKKFLADSLQNGNFQKRELFEILTDSETAADDELPDTGIGLEKERMLSPVFITSQDYGTRLSTVMSIRNDGLVNFHERSHNPTHDQEFEFRLEQ
ncbi:MAG: NRDE family protein [Vicingaceae bacterium]